MEQLQTWNKSQAIGKQSNEDDDVSMLIVPSKVQAIGIERNDMWIMDSSATSQMADAKSIFLISLLCNKDMDW